MMPICVGQVDLRARGEANASTQMKNKEKMDAEMGNEMEHARAANCRGKKPGMLWI